MRTKGILQMRLSHSRPVVAARFDEPNLVSAAGLVPVLRLARDAGLGRLAGELLTVPSDKGVNAGGKVTALVAANGQVIATSADYERRQAALNGTESVRKNAPEAEIATSGDE